MSARRPSVACVDEPLTEAVVRMDERGVDRMPVVDPRLRTVGARWRETSWPSRGPFAVCVLLKTDLHLCCLRTDDADERELRQIQRLRTGASVRDGPEHTIGRCVFDHGVVSAC